MKRIYRKLFGVLFLLLLAVLIGVPVWITYKDVQQQQLDRALIAAIKKQDTNKVIALLNEGANANARDVPRDPRPFWRQFWDGLQGKRDRSQPFTPSALLLAVSGPPETEVAPENLSLVNAPLRQRS